MKTLCNWILGIIGFIAFLCVAGECDLPLGQFFLVKFGALAVIFACLLVARRINGVEE